MKRLKSINKKFIIALINEPNLNKLTHFEKEIKLFTIPNFSCIEAL